MPTRLFCWGDYAEYYDYLADGTKVRHAYQDGQERIYAGSLVYDQGVFESAPFGGGRIVSTYDDSEAHYFLTDHLGSTRVVAKVTSAGRDDLDRKDYYPFGKAWTQADMPTSGNRYTFSGKEQVDVAIEDGITTPIHDFGARYYDPDGVLFFQQDPLMEKYYSIGQYNYCAGNPVKYIDPNGKWIESAWDFASLLLGFDSLTDNIKSGNVGGIVVDSFGIVLDGAALLLPIPGGVSAGIKAARTTDKAVDAAKASKAVEKASDATKVTGKTVDSKNSARFVGDTDGKIIDTESTPAGSYAHPDGSRTDILQKKSHFDKKTQTDLGTTHTHEPYSNTLPDGSVKTGASNKRVHKPTHEEVERIKSGEAKRVK